MEYACQLQSERGAWWFQTVQLRFYEHDTTGLLSELWSCDRQNLLSTLLCQILILNTTSENIQTIQCGYCYWNADRVTRHNRQVGNWSRCYRAFLQKFSPNLMSNFMWHSICWYPMGMSSLFPSKNSKYCLKFFISCWIESHHKVSPFYLLTRMAYHTVFGILWPYLCVFCQYLMDVLD